MREEIAQLSAAYLDATINLIVEIRRHELPLLDDTIDKKELSDVEEPYRAARGVFWIALANGNVIGTVGLVDLGGGQGCLQKMYVHPEFRGKGAAARLDNLSIFVTLAVLTLIWFGAAFFFGKKVKSHRANVLFDMHRPGGHVTIVRMVDPTNYARKFKILVDGKILSSIDAGETIHLKMPHGTYQVQAKIDFCVTMPISVQVRDSHNVELVCGSTYNDWRCIFMWAIKPRNHIYLRTAA